MGRGNYGYHKPTKRSFGDRSRVSVQSFNLFNIHVFCMSVLRDIGNYLARLRGAETQAYLK